MVLSHLLIHLNGNSSLPLQSVYGTEHNSETVFLLVENDIFATLNEGRVVCPPSG